eukprot:COSAG04_NODE_195_length_20819_cov_5.821718_10_plen_168_part_00
MRPRKNCEFAMQQGSQQQHCIEGSTSSCVLGPQLSAARGQPDSLCRRRLGNPGRPLRRSSPALSGRLFWPMPDEAHVCIPEHSETGVEKHPRVRRQQEKVERVRDSPHDWPIAARVKRCGSEWVSRGWEGSAHRRRSSALPKSARARPAARPPAWRCPRRGGGGGRR